MTRSSMTGLITRVSTLINDPTNATFSTQQVQDALDGTRVTWNGLRLEAVPLWSGNSLKYTAFESPYGGGWESDYALYDSSRNAVTAASAELVDTGRWEITSGGGVYTTDPFLWIVGKQYDLHAAAAELCDTWASQLKLQYELQSGAGVLGRHRSQLAQKYAQTAATAALMRRQARVKVVKLVRSDIRPGM